MAQVLSFNSRLAYGHVGGEGSSFALRRLGHEVWQIPTVQFSNHPGHGGFRGGPVPGERIRELMQGLMERDLLRHCAGLHSGYLGSAAVAEEISRAREALPDALYLCDPVMGDAGKPYVSDEVIAAICDDLLPLANVVTPNRFELSILAGRTADNLEEVLSAARQLLARGPELVICTSAAVDAKEITTLLVTAERAVALAAPFVGAAPHGTGDVFAALLLAGLLDGRDAAAVTEKAVAAIADLVGLDNARIPGEISVIAGQEYLLQPRQTVRIRAL